MVIRETGEWHQLTRRQGLTLCYLMWNEIADMESYTYDNVDTIKATTDVVKQYKIENDCAFCDHSRDDFCHDCLGCDLWPKGCLTSKESLYVLFIKTLDPKYAREIADYCADKLCDVNYW